MESRLGEQRNSRFIHPSSTSGKLVVLRVILCFGILLKLPGQSAPFDMIISDDSSANIASGSLNVQSEEYAMLLPAAVFEMNGQSGGVMSLA